MAVVSRLVLLLLALLGSVVTEQCPNGWLRYNSSCYLFGKTNIDWADAWTFCKTMESALVEIETPQEDNFIRSTLKNSHAHDSAPPHGYWIGLTDVEIKNEWKWIGSGKQISNVYSNWEKGQPQLRQSEDCAILWHSTGYTWHDDFCSDNIAHFICEKSDDLSRNILAFKPVNNQISTPNPPKNRKPW